MTLETKVLEAGPLPNGNSTAKEAVGFTPAAGELWYISHVTYYCDGSGESSPQNANAGKSFDGLGTPGIDHSDSSNWSERTAIGLPYGNAEEQGTDPVGTYVDETERARILYRESDLTGNVEVKLHLRRVL